MDLDEMLAASGISQGGGAKTKAGFATFIGRPNVGKSTLMNKLIGQKVAITSGKPQTTRNRIRTIYTSKKGQIVFLDTPGIHKAKNKLGEYMVETAISAIGDVDVVIFVVEPSKAIGSLEEKIIERLKMAKCPVILAVNKTDRIKKAEVADAISVYTKAMHFEQIVAVSAKCNTNIDSLTDAIYDCLPYGPAFYDEEQVTDQTVRQIASEIIREKALRNLSEEIPHGIAVVIDSFKDRKAKNGTITDIDATIICEKNSHKGIVIGKGGEMLKKIGTESRKDIEDQLGNKVNLKLWVKVRKEWRDNPSIIKSLGYDPKKEN